MMSTNNYVLLPEGGVYTYMAGRVLSPSTRFHGNHAISFSCKLLQLSRQDLMVVTCTVIVVSHSKTRDQFSSRA